MDDNLDVWLPLLRRLARAATGDARSGDDAVRRCVGQLLANGHNGSSSREHAFQELARSLAKADVALPASALLKLPLRQRLAYLLTRLEQLPPEEAARVLELSPRRLELLVGAAIATLGEPAAARVLIIEDEPTTALDLEEIIERDGHDVVGIAATHAEAVDLARSERPALLLADVRLADDSSGVDAVVDINASGAVPAIYVTAFPAQALEEAGPGSLVVPKPFAPGAVSGAIAEALSLGVPPPES